MARGLLPDIVSFVRGTQPAENWKGLVVAALRLYLDDGGHENDTPVFVVGGYVAALDDWGRFETDWSRSHREAWARHAKRTGIDCPNELPPFHMSDLQSGDGGGHYRAWSKDEREDLITSMALTISRNLGQGIARGIVVGDYDKIIRPKAQMFRAGTAVNNFPAVAYCLRMCIEWVSHIWPGRPPDQKVHVFFEGGTKHLGEAVEYCSKLKGSKPWGDVIRQIVIVDKREAAAQAADYLAYNAYRSTLALSKNQAYGPEHLQASMQGCRVSYGYQTADEMQLAALAVETSAEEWPR